MKKIIVIDGGPRKNFNTASMLQKFTDGANSVSSQIEVKTIRLYGLDYKGLKNYDRFELGGFSEEAKRQYRDENWEKDLQKAFDAGRRMAHSILE